jgi:hypothetical protein
MIEYNSVQVKMIHERVTVEKRGKRGSELGKSSQRK